MKFELDTRQFDSAMKQYVAGSKREFADICNRTALDVARFAIKYSKKSNKESIRAVDKESWWPKYIAKRISQGKGKFSVRSKHGVRNVQITTGYTKAQAKSLSTKIIAARIRSRAFLAAGWIASVQKFAKTVFGSEGRTTAPGGVKLHGSPKGYGIPAKARIDPVAFIVHTGLRATKFSEKPNPHPHVWRALQMSINRKTVDFKKVIVSRMQKLAKKHSARR